MRPNLGNWDTGEKVSGKDLIPGGKNEKGWLPHLNVRPSVSAALLRA